MSTAYRLGELAQRIGGTVHGDPDRLIRGIATLDDAGADDLSFLTNPRYRVAAAATQAAALLVGPSSGLSHPALLEARRPYAALADLLALFYPTPDLEPGVSPDARLGRDVELGQDVRVEAFAVIGDASVLGDRVVIGAGSVVGRDCTIGEASELKPRVVIYPGTQVGARCLIHAGVVLGGDGFGFATTGGVHAKVPQVGRVIVEDDVEIGANSTADRAMMGETRIGEGSKIDNLAMIAHGVHLGPRALIAAQSGIAGSARLGANATLAGQSGVAGHLELGSKTVIAAKSAVFDDQPDGAFVAGIPAVDHRLWKRSRVVVRRLPELQKELRDLRTRLSQLEQKLATED